MITSAKYLRNEQVGASTYRVCLQLTDDVTGTRDQWFTVQGETLVAIRDDASRQIVEINRLLSIKNVLAGIAVNTNIPVTYTPPAATAFEVWRDKVRRVLEAKAIGLTNSTATDELAALVADINATYVSGYVGQL